MKKILIILLGLAYCQSFALNSINFLDKDAMKLALQIGNQDLGKKEIGNNHGEHIKKYGLAVFNKPIDGFYYCYAFQYWSYDEACKRLGIINYLPKTAHCLTGWNIAKKFFGADKFELQVNSQLIWASKNGNGHTERISSIIDYQRGIVICQGANTGGDVRNGGYVKLTKRNIKHPLGTLFLKGSFNAK